MSTKLLPILLALSFGGWVTSTMAADQRYQSSREGMCVRFKGDWASPPTQSEVRTDYPPAALAKGQSGEGHIKCLIKPDGGLTDCIAEGELPARSGFAVASVRLAALLKAKPPSAGEWACAGLKWTPTALSIEPPPPPGVPPVIISTSTRQPDPPPPPLRPTRYPEPPRPVGPSVITNSDWVRRPNGNDFATAYPPGALKAGIEGHSTMECTVQGDGTLTACHIVSEASDGQGFGLAELQLASKFRMRSQTVDGAPVAGAHVVIPMSWKIAGDPTPPVVEPAAQTPADPTPH